MMRPLIPIFMGLLNMVASKTEPIYYADGSIGSSVDRDRRNDMLMQTGSSNVDPNDFAELKTLAERHQRINLNDYGIEPRDWTEPETSYDNDLTIPRKIVTHENNIDDDALEELESASLSIDEMDENDLNHLSRFLSSVLRQPTYEPPLVIVEEPIFSQDSEEAESDTYDANEIRPNVWKRSRYYRHNPSYKRQNSRSRNGYDYDAAHFCNPTRDDIVKLLVALHEVRKGNKSHSVRFCKRRRSAGTLFTNIRFLGRRK